MARGRKLSSSMLVGVAEKIARVVLSFCLRPSMLTDQASVSWYATDAKSPSVFTLSVFCARLFGVKKFALEHGAPIVPDNAKQSHVASPPEPDCRKVCS